MLKNHTILGLTNTTLNKTRDLDKKIIIDVKSKFNFEIVIELGCETEKYGLLSQKDKQDFSEEILNL